MRRREFITLLGGAAIWPLSARAQQGERVRRVGVLMNQSADDPETKARTKAFLQGMQELGWIDGRNMRVDIRWEAGDVEHARKMAAELVALSPDVILSSGVTGLSALQKIRHIPVVFAIAPDPVGAGFVDSLARPGGNVTGFMQFEYSLSGKRNSSNKNVLALALTIPRLPACNVLLLTWRTRELGSSAAQCVQRPGKRLGDAFPVVIRHGYFAERAAV